MNLSDLYCNRQLLSQFFLSRSLTDGDALLLCSFVEDFVCVCVCVAESMSELFLSEASGSVYSFLSQPLDAFA